MKKLLSIILAAAMILSLVPSVFAEGEATEEPTTYVYDFQKSAEGVKNLTGIKDESYSDYNGRNWMFYRISGETDTAYNEKVTNGETDLYNIAGINGRLLFKPQNASTEWLALKIKVPEAGIYTVSCQIYQKSSYSSNCYMSMFYGNNFNEAQKANSKRLLGTQISFAEGDKTTKVIPFTNVVYANEKNAEFIYLIGNGNSKGYIAINSITLEKVSDTLNLDAESIDLTLGENESQTVTASLVTNTPLGFLKPAYSIEDETVATVDANGVVKAVSDGKTTLYATIGDVTASIPVTVTAPVEDELFTEEFGEGAYETDSTPAFAAPTEGKATTTVNTYTAVIGGTNSTATPHTVKLGEEFSITADEKDSGGNVFRYWALGLSENKKVLTRGRTLKFMPTVETKHVIAVYEPENCATVTGESFYNANGQLLTDVQIADEKMPPLPSMTGYGKASAWVQYGTGTEFAEGADAPTENKMFVAKYAEPTVTYAINVVDGTGEGNYTYGQEVTCTATIPEGKIFKCWTKTPVGGTAKIISLDEEYTFSAWEACTIKAEFADKEPVFTGKKFSIILSEMTGKVDNNTAYMAEFVGLGDAVEKGIQFGTKRVAMTTDAAQFTAVNDINGVVDENVKGYAILPDGTVIYDK